MTTTLAYRGKRVAFLGWSDTEGHPVTHGAASHAWIAQGETHADGVGFSETGSAYLVDADELRRPFPYAGCEACGWQYPDETMRAYSKGRLTIDENPTHLCQPGRRELDETIARHPAGKRLVTNREPDLWRMLANIERQVQRACKALNDEHEGDLREAIESLGSEADDARHLVRTW